MSPVNVETGVHHTMETDLPPPRILIFLADVSQEPRTAAIPWKILTQAGCVVDFATEHGAVAKGDQRVLVRSWFRDAVVRSETELSVTLLADDVCSISIGC